jgi:hypothetical protein
MPILVHSSTSKSQFIPSAKVNATKKLRPFVFLVSFHQYCCAVRFLGCRQSATFYRGTIKREVQHDRAYLGPNRFFQLKR